MQQYSLKDIISTTSLIDIANDFVVFETKSVFMLLCRVIDFKISVYTLLWLL